MLRHRLHSRRGPVASACAIAVLAFALTAAVPANAEQVVIQATRDNTMFQAATGTPSNGAGEYLFTGRTKDGFARRALIHFDVAAHVPAGAVVNSVTLSMNVSRVKNNTARATSLHRVLAAWGEGTSNAGQNEGEGALPTVDDATWLHRRYPDSLWTTPGGDFTASASATTNLLATGPVVWSGAGLVADVEAWRANPALNHGWLLRGDESATETAKRLDSSENATLARRPVLTIDYTCVPEPCTPGPSDTTTVDLGAIADNTLYESATGALSNGAGTKLIVSRSNSVTKRGLVRFDLSSIPANATVHSATLTLYNAHTGSNATDISLWRASASWGEAGSLATGTEETGAPAATGDATWLHRFFPSTSWTTAGGDFAAAASATTTVGDVGSYAFTAPALAADVQSWLDTPASNHGWVLRGRESQGGNGLKRFESRNSADPARRPVLRVRYTAPAGDPIGACCLPGGTCEEMTEAECLAAMGAYHGDDSDCSGADCPVVLTPYVDPLPRPAVAVPVSGTPGGAAEYVIPIREVSQQLHRDLPPTRVWGYGGSYPGPTLEVASGVPITVTWWNDLRDSLGAPRATHYLPVDQCLHGPDEAGPTARVVTHVHGGHVPAMVDGHPDSTLLPGEQATYVYPNQQPPGTVWYHDHALGITRLNVMMGLAGFFLIRDPFEAALGLPAGEYEIGLAMQDRMFHPNGALRYPPTWAEHFEGDKMLVNGKVWPYLQVKQGKYRFRLLNGCNSRVLRLGLSNGMPFTVIGTDLGLLPAPVVRDSLLMSPGERYDVVLDFAGLAAGTQIVLGNDAPAMFPGVPGEGVIPNVMRFDVVAAAGHLAPLPAQLRPVAPPDTAAAVLERDFVLRKMSGPCGYNMWMINDLPYDTVSEYPVLGTTEIWRFINESGVTHPMHMHLVQFQVLDRQSFVRVGGEIVPVGAPAPPDPSEAGYKDTAPVGPNEILRVIARFEDYTGHYAYHCHILEHEDNEMMRQFRTVDTPGLVAHDSSAVEGDVPGAAVTFRVALTSPVQVEVRVAARTVDGTALAGLDYEAVEDTLVFPPGVTEQTLVVPILPDEVPEYAETFTVHLEQPVNATLVDSVATGTIEDDEPTTDVPVGIPAVTFLGGRAPNPSRGFVAIHWGLSAGGRADMEVFTVEGRRIRTLIAGVHEPGVQVTRWDGRDERGVLVPSGLYVVRLTAGGREYRATLLRVR